MTEQNDELETVEAIVYDHNELVIEGLRKEIEALTASVTRIEKNRDYYHEQKNSYEIAISRAKDALFEAIKEHEIGIDSDLVETIADIFGWSLTQEVTITLTATFEGTLTIPLGNTIDDIDGSDFTADISLDWDRDRQDWEFDLDSTEIELEER